MGDEFKKMFRLIEPGKVIRLILWGENLILLMRSLLHILQKEEMPQQNLSSPSASPSPAASHPAKPHSSEPSSPEAAKSSNTTHKPSSDETDEKNTDDEAEEDEY